MPATALLRPNANITEQWTVTDGGSSSFQVLDDAVTQPTAPSIAADFISSATINEVCEVAVGTVTVGGAVSQAKLWVYSRTDLTGGSHDAKLMKGATEIASVTVAQNQGAAWRSATYTGTLTQTEIDDLRIKLVKNNTATAGDNDVFAAYVELTYTQGPTTALRPNADISNDWTVNDGGSTQAWQVLDDAVTQPTAPSTAGDDIVAASAVAAQISEVALTTVAASEVFEATVWYYAQNGLTSGAVTVELRKGVTVIASGTMAGNVAAAWRSFAFTGNLTQAEVDDLRVRFTRPAGTTSATGYAAYVDLTYTAAAGGGGTAERNRMLMGIG